MSIEVEWQIIEGEGREAETIIAPPPPQPKRRLPKWVFALAAIPVVAAAIVGGYMAWVYRVQLGRATREVSVVAKAEARAIAAGDQQSFMALQDPDDPAWRTLQERRFGRLERLGIPEFGLAPTGASPQPGDVTLEPGGARLDMLRQFSVTQPMPGGPAVITLRVPQFYRQTPSGWVRAQPSAEFWGSRRTITGKHVLALYSRRDADIVESLIPQLDRVLEKACVNLKCPSQATLTFETSQDAAGYGGISTYSFGEGSLTIQFASPYFSGLPVDTASRDELYRVIETRVVRGLVAASWPGQQRGRDSVVYQQITRWHLAQAGLSGPYITPAMTGTLLAAMQNGTLPLLSNVVLEMRSTGSDKLFSETMVPLAFAFIVERLGADSLVKLTPALATSATLGQALRSTLRLNPMTLEADWQAYVRRQAGLTAVVETLPPVRPEPDFSFRGTVDILDVQKDQQVILLGSSWNWATCSNIAWRPSS